jgi:hypothetical protein
VVPSNCREEAWAKPGLPFCLAAISVSREFTHGIRDQVMNTQAEATMDALK